MCRAQSGNGPCKWRAWVACVILWPAATRGQDEIRTRQEIPPQPTKISINENSVVTPSVCIELLPSADKIWINEFCHKKFIKAQKFGRVDQGMYKWYRVLLLTYKIILKLCVITDVQTHIKTFSSWSFTTISFFLFFLFQAAYKHHVYVACVPVLIYVCMSDFNMFHVHPTFATFIELYSVRSFQRTNLAPTIYVSI